MPRLFRLIAAKDALIRPRPKRAQVVAAAGPLELDHVGAEVAHQRGAVRPRDDAREIEDADALEHHRAVSHDRGIPPSSR